MLLHPNYKSFPVSTYRFGKTEFNYNMHADHDLYKGTMESFMIFDHTNYPKTINPASVNYQEATYPSREILGVRSKLKGKPVMELECVMYWEETCPLKKEGYDKNIKMVLRSLRLLHMQEYMFRLNDYFFY